MYRHEFEKQASAGAEIPDGGAVYGHLYFGVHEALGISARYVTVIRHPVDRVVSFYRQQARDANSDYFDTIAKGMTIADLLHSGCHQVNNHMVRIISGYKGDGHVDDWSVLKEAVANLAHFEVVGLTERMNESVAWLAQRLGWPTCPTVPRLNVSTNVSTVDDATRAEIRRFNRLDLELYELVRSQWPLGMSQILPAQQGGSQT